MGYEQVLHCGCLPQWKQEKTGSQLLLFSRVKSGDRRRANKKLNGLIDPRICLKPTP